MGFLEPSIESMLAAGEGEFNFEWRFPTYSLFFFRRADDQLEAPGPLLHGADGRQLLEQRRLRWRRRRHEDLLAAQAVRHPVQQAGAQPAALRGPAGGGVQPGAALAAGGPGHTGGGVKVSAREWDFYVVGL